MKPHPYYHGRLALVMGGSQGIGRAVAVGLARLGCNVVVAARRQGPLEETLALLREARSERDAVLGQLLVDVRDPASVEAGVGEMVARFGVPDLALNCAGAARPGYLHELSAADLADQVTLNYLGTAWPTRALLPHLLERRRGHLVHTSSIAGFLGLSGYTAYCGSKFAVMGFSEALRREVAPFGLRVTVLCPPNTRTPGLEEENRLKPAEVLATEQKVATLEPEQVAEALLRALPGGRFLVIPSLDGSAAHALNRYAPALLDWLLRS